MVEAKAFADMISWFPRFLEKRNFNVFFFFSSYRAQEKQKSMWGQKCNHALRTKSTAFYMLCKTESSYITHAIMEHMS